MHRAGRCAGGPNVCGRPHSPRQHRSIAGFERRSHRYALDVLEHIEDDVPVLNQSYGKLRPEGRVLIYVPGIFSCFARTWTHESIIFNDVPETTSETRRAPLASR